MSQPKKSNIEVRGTSVTIASRRQNDGIGLDDIARDKNGGPASYLIQNWKATGANTPPQF